MPIFSDPADARPWPDATTSLAPAERFLLRAFRLWISGLRENAGAYWSRVWNDFAREFGAADGREALTAFACLVKELQCHARRRITYHRPCCPCLGGDEASILALVAACHGPDLAAARALARGLVEADGVGDLVGAGARLGTVMRRHGKALTRRGSNGEAFLGGPSLAAGRGTVH